MGFVGSLGVGKLGSVGRADGLCSRKSVVVMGTGNSFGKLFKISTWGESHGIGVGVTIDGCPPRLEVSRKWMKFGRFMLGDTYVCLMTYSAFFSLDSCRLRTCKRSLIAVSLDRAS